jgi:hypothetical protein
VAAEDPHPTMPFLDAIQMLKALFPNGKIDYHPSSREVFISLPLTDGGEFRAGLIWQQAKYLALSEMTGDDFKSCRFPADWPV